MVLCKKYFTRVLIIDEDDNILVVQDRTNLWNFPGGKQELGETPFGLCKTGNQEEIGLSVHKLTEVYQEDFYFGNTQWKGYFYFEESVIGVLSMNEVDKIKESGL
ncbi:NUDIX hydrolase [Bacillus sp. FSL K6-3431]|uniref:NUDIX hydrolase n=1 Tax=Bacillus sp. FSL K6-3431 TaxID=2921500 RepID=UPI0030F8D502